MFSCTFRYRGFIIDASDESTFRAEYIQMNKYWHILAIKLATALIFEVYVSHIMDFVNVAIDLSCMP